jgi:hypothetical protein
MVLVVHGVAPALWPHHARATLRTEDLGTVEVGLDSTLGIGFWIQTQTNFIPKWILTKSWNQARIQGKSVGGVLYPYAEGFVLYKPRPVTLPPTPKSSRRSPSSRPTVEGARPWGKLAAWSRGLTIEHRLSNTPNVEDRPRWDSHLALPRRSKPPLSFTHQSCYATSPESGTMALLWRPPRRCPFGGISPHRPSSGWQAWLDPSDTPSLRSIRAVGSWFNGHGFMKGHGPVRRAGGLGP